LSNLAKSLTQLIELKIAGVYSYRHQLVAIK